MKRSSYLLFTIAVILIFLVFSACSLNDGSDLSSDVSNLNSETSSDMASVSHALSEISNAAESRIKRPPTAPPEPVSSAQIQRFTPTLDGTGLKFESLNLEDCSDDTILIQEMTRICNRLLYGIGVYAGCYDITDYFMLPQLVSYEISYESFVGSDCAKLTLDYEVPTVDEKGMTLTVSAMLRCDSTKICWDQIEYLYFLVELPDSPYRYSYDTVAGPLFTAISVETGTAEGWYELETGIWTPSDTGDTTGNDASVIPPATTLDDSALTYKAYEYLCQIALEIKKEENKAGYKTFTASPDSGALLYLPITNRTESTVTVQGKIYYWYDRGGYYDGVITVSLVIDAYNGDLIIYSTH